MAPRSFAASLRRSWSCARRQGWCGAKRCISKGRRWLLMPARNRSPSALPTKRTFTTCLGQLPRKRESILSSPASSNTRRRDKQASRRDCRSLVALPTSLSQEEQEQLAEHNAERHDWVAELGAQNRSVTSHNYQRTADYFVSTTDPDATVMRTKGGVDLGYHVHYVVDGGKARIILQVLVTPSEVMDNQPMLDLLWRVRFRWKLWLRQVTGDKKYGTEDNLVAIEGQSMRAYIPIPDMDHRTEFFSSQEFTYDTKRDIYVCPAGKDLRFDRPHSTERSRRYRARAKDCNHCPLKAKCTTSKQGRSLCRSVDEACLDRVRSYQATEAYKKALRKRQVWVEPLFAEAKDWHGMRRFRLRRLWRVNCEALRIAAGQNLKRLLKKRSWGRRPFPAEALCAFFLASCWWETRTVLADVPFPLLIGSDYPVNKRKCIIPS